MDQDLQIRVARWIPLAQRLRNARGRRRDDEAALRGNVTATHGRAVRHFGFAFGQLGQIDFVEDGKAGQLGGGVGENIRNPEREQTENGKYFHKF